jgi:mono/diheme cytochrome c family protein
MSQATAQRLPMRQAFRTTALPAISMTAGAQIKPAPKFTAAQLQALPTDSWITNGGTLCNQRYSPMPPFRGTLSTEQLRDVAHYISDELPSSHAR